MDFEEFFFCNFKDKKNPSSVNHLMDWVSLENLIREIDFENLKYFYLGNLANRFD